MIAKQLMMIGAMLLFVLSGAPAMSEEKSAQHIQIAEIVVDPAQLDSYKSAVAEQIEAAIRLEAGVLALYSVSNPDHGVRDLPGPRSLSRSPASTSLSEVQGDRREDGQIAQADASGPVMLGSQAK